MSVCRSCAAPIRWAISRATGKNIPLDAEPSPGGNVELVDIGARNGLMEQRAVVLTGFDLMAAQEEGRTLYLSHFATCAQADQHRRTR